MLVLVAMLVPAFAACGVQKDDNPPDDNPSEDTGYTITFHLNSGKFADGANVPERYKTGDTPADLPIPVKANAVFIGWFEKADADPAKDTKYTKVPTDRSQNLDFYALWDESGEYTITYHLNGGTFTSDVQTSFTVDDEEWLMPIPERKGYTFRGWFDEDEEEYVRVPTDEARNLEFWAEWRVVNYNLTLNANGGKLTGSSSLTYTVEDGKIKLPTPTGETEFLGWYISSKFIGDPLTEWDASSLRDVQLYAKWARAKKKITLNANGGALESGSVIEYTNDKGYITLPTPTQSGKYFVAWYTDAACTSAPMWKFRSLDLMFALPAEE